MAYLQKDADFGQTFTFDEHNIYRFQLKATGLPTMTLPWCKIGKTEDDAEVVLNKDPMGTSYEVKFWYDEKEQVLKSWSKNLSNGVIALQIRKINDDGLMTFTHTSTKPDGSSVTHSAVLKKVV